MPLLFARRAQHDGVALRRLGRRFRVADTQMTVAMAVEIRLVGGRQVSLRGDFTHLHATALWS